VTRTRIFVAVLVLFVILPLCAAAQDKGYWRASNQTAQSITGDIFIAEGKLTINFMAFPLAQIRQREPLPARHSRVSALPAQELPLRIRRHAVDGDLRGKPKPARGHVLRAEYSGAHVRGDFEIHGCVRDVQLHALTTLTA
jgi:hypothetical protein